MLPVKSVALTRSFCGAHEAKRLEFASTCPELSVVIATRNSWQFLPDCLAAIRTDDSVLQEIVIVDNGSSDGTLSQLRQHHPSVRVVSNATNEGHCRAINRGLRMARGKYVLVLDADTVVGPGVTRQLVEFMRKRPDVVIAAPKMINGDGTVQESARTFPRPVNSLFGRQTMLASLFPTISSHAIMCAGIRPIQWSHSKSTGSPPPA